MWSDLEKIFRNSNILSLFQDREGRCLWLGSRWKVKSSVGTHWLWPLDSHWCLSNGRDNGKCLVILRNWQKQRIQERHVVRDRRDNFLSQVMKSALMLACLCLCVAATTSSASSPPATESCPGGRTSSTSTRWDVTWLWVVVSHCLSYLFSCRIQGEVPTSQSNIIFLWHIFSGCSLPLQIPLTWTIIFPR